MKRSKQPQPRGKLDLAVEVNVDVDVKGKVNVGGEQDELGRQAKGRPRSLGRLWWCLEWGGGIVGWLLVWLGRGEPMPCNCVLEAAGIIILYGT